MDRIEHPDITATERNGYSDEWGLARILRGATFYGGLVYRRGCEEEDDEG